MAKQQKRKRRPLIKINLFVVLRQQVLKRLTIKM